MFWCQLMFSLLTLVNLVTLITLLSLLYLLSFLSFLTLLNLLFLLSLLEKQRYQEKFTFKINFLPKKQRCLLGRKMYSSTSVSSAVNSCYSSRDHRNLLEALYDKTCLPNCVGNSLETHFLYLNISVSQKLTELQIFGCHLWKTYFLET